MGKDDIIKVWCNEGVKGGIECIILHISGTEKACLFFVLHVMSKVRDSDYYVFVLHAILMYSQCKL